MFGGMFKRKSFIDMGFFFLVIEVDEFQHKRGAYSCEKKRMQEITNMLGGPTVFLRYNPDNEDSDIDALLNRVKYWSGVDAENLDFDGVFGTNGFITEYLWSMIIMIG